MVVHILCACVVLLGFLLMARRASRIFALGDVSIADVAVVVAVSVVAMSLKYTTVIQQ